MPSLKMVGELSLDSTGFNRGLSAASARAQQFSGGLRSALGGAFSVAAITAFAKHTIDAVSRIADLSKELNISAESLQELEYAAKLSGASVEAIATAFRGVSKARAEALKDPKSQAGQVFGAMGISQDELKSNSIEQTFRRIAEVVRTTDFGANEIAMVSELLGRSGQELIPVFRNGLEAAAEEGKKLGLFIKDGVVDQIDAAGDAIDKLTMKLRSVMAPALVAAADKIRGALDWLDKKVGGVGAWIGTIAGGGNAMDAYLEMVNHEDEVTKRIQDAEEARANKAAGNNKPDERNQSPWEWNNDKPGQQISTRRDAVSGDQFQRIGAFTGTSAMAGQRELAYRQLTVLEKLREDLTRTGIIIRGTD